MVTWAISMESLLLRLLFQDFTEVSADDPDIEYIYAGRCLAEHLLRTRIALMLYLREYDGDIIGDIVGLCLAGGSVTHADVGGLLRSSVQSCTFSAPCSMGKGFAILADSYCQPCS